MTISTHHYTATLLDTGTVLEVVSGSVTLDAGGAPQVTGTMDVGATDLTTFNAMDPRLTPRVRLVATATFDSGDPSQSRTFDLGIRDRRVSQAFGEQTITLELASDEALMGDYAPIADDRTPRTLETSLRGITNYVLGASIATRRNRVPNPGFAVNTTGWGASTGATSLIRVTTVNGVPTLAGQWTATGSGTSQIRAENMPVTPGEVLAFRVSLQAGQAGSYTGQVQVAFIDSTGTLGGSDGTQIGSAIPGATVAVNNSGFATARLGSIVPPDGAAYVRLYPKITNATTSDIFFADTAHIDRGTTTGTYFDGSNASVAGFQYLWDGTAGKSTSHEAPLLASTPNNEANVKCYWPVTNLHPDPNGVNTTGTANSVGGSAFTAVTLLSVPALRWTAAAGTVTVYVAGFDASTSTFKGIAVTPGQVYVGSTLLSSSTARSATVKLQFRSSDNVVVTEFSSATATTPVGSYSRYTTTGTAPLGASYACLVVTTTSNSAGQFHYSRHSMIYQDDLGEIVPDFDGGTADGTGNYNYDWTGTADASASTRTPSVIDRPRDSLLWSAGQSGLDFLAPLLQANGFRLVCDEARSWTIRSATYLASGTVAIRTGINMYRLEDTVSRDSDTWFDAAATRYVWTDGNGIERNRVDAYASPGFTKTRLFEKDTAYPGPGFSQYAVTRARGRGREIAATTFSDWTVQTEQLATFVVDSSTTVQTGTTQTVEYNLDTDEMTVTARSVDLSTGAVDLLVGTVDALVGSVNSL